jgi:hypothetical protein
MGIESQKFSTLDNFTIVYNKLSSHENVFLCRNSKLPSRARRSLIHRRLLDTEMQYISHLEQFQSLSTQLDGSETSSQSLFDCITLLLQLHRVMLKQLQQEETISKSFTQIAPFLKMYVQYLNQSHSLETDQNFTKLSKKCSGPNLSFEQLLKIPIQMIEFYAPIIQDYRLSTPKSHPDHDPLINALQIMEGVLLYIRKAHNDFKTKRELLDIWHQLDFKVEYDINLPLVLYHKGSVYLEPPKTPSKGFKLFKSSPEIWSLLLSETGFILFEEKTFKKARVLKPIKSCHPREVSDEKDEKTSFFGFTVAFGEPRTADVPSEISFFVPSFDEQEEWIDHINRFLADTFERKLKYDMLKEGNVCTAGDDDTKLPSARLQSNDSESESSDRRQ